MTRLKQLIKLFGKQATVNDVAARINSIDFIDGLIFALRGEK